MTDYIDNLDPNNLVNVVNELMARVRALESREVNLNAIDEISNDMGIMLAGEFRSGEGEPGSGFTGGRFGYPGFLYNGKFWFLTGVNNDRLMVGLDLETGEIVGAGGKLTIGEQGIVLEGLLNAILQKATGGWADGEEETRYGKLGMFLPDGSKIPAFGMELTDDVSGDPVISNGLFDTGDLTGWDPSLGGSTLFGVVTDKLPTYVDGFVLESQERPDVTDEETLTGISSDVVAGDKYNFSLWTRDDYIVTDIETNENLNIDESNPTFAQGGLTDFGSNAWLEAGYYLGQTEQRTLLRFDSAEAADVTVVDEAGLVYYIRKSGLTLGTVPLVIRYLLTDWDWETATWNNKNAATNWNTAGVKGVGTDIGAAIVGTDSIVAASTEEGYRYTDIDPAIIQNWLDGAINFYGLMMTGTTLSGNNALDIGLKEKEVGAFLRISERPVYKCEVRWWTGSGATGTLVRVDNIASNNDIPSWNERKAVLTVPTGAVSFSMVITATRGKLFQMANIVVKRLSVSTKLFLNPNIMVQDNYGTRRVLSTVKEITPPASCSAGVLTGTVTLVPTLDGFVSMPDGGRSFVSNTLYFGKSPTGTNDFTISFLFFDFGSLLSIPAEITSATIRLVKIYDAASSNLSPNFKRALRPWNANATYATYDGTNVWQTQPGQGANDVANDVETAAQVYNYTEGDTTVHTHTLIPSVVLGMINGTYPNYGFHFYAPSGNTTKFGIASADHATESYRPLLTLEIPSADGAVTIGNHYYKITAIDASGETTPSPASSVCTNTATYTVNRITLPTIVGATGFGIYRTKAGGSEYFKVANAPVCTYYDDLLADADLYDIQPPLVNLTSSRPQFPKQATANALSFVSNATLTITATGVAPLLTTTAANANDGDTFDTDVWMNEGTYTLHIHARKETTAGKADITLDGVSVATGQDFYAASAAAFLLSISNVVVVGSGYHRLRLTINGKHASSTDYTMNLYSVTFTPAAH